MGLDVSSFGNHEFDQGRADVDDRILDRGRLALPGREPVRPGDRRAGLPGVRAEGVRRRDRRLHRRRHRGAADAGQPGRHRDARRASRSCAEVNRVAEDLTDGDEAQRRGRRAHPARARGRRDTGHRESRPTTRASARSSTVSTPASG